MQASYWLQLALLIGALTAVTKPLGLYLGQVLSPLGKTLFDPLIAPFERLTYRVLGVRADQEQTWKQYAGALFLFGAMIFLFIYTVLRLQPLLPLNPQGRSAIGHDLALNIAASFATGTNWQSYAGETTLSYFSQMVALGLGSFVSAAMGLAAAAALIRGIARQSARTIGSFWVDVTRITYYLLVPLCLALAVFLVSQGVLQNFEPYVRAQTLEGGSQVLPQGPVASQVAIKMLGTNGGGYTNANAAHPFENPTPLSNFIQLLAFLAIGAGLTYHLGRATENPAHGRAIWTAMLLIFIVSAVLCVRAEQSGNPLHRALGVAAEDGNLEGKEVRVGVFNSAVFAAATTSASCGAVNAMHDSFTPLGGMVPLVNMLLGGVAFGGVGSGLYHMLLFVVLTVFLAGLMVGRTPEYLGKKIQVHEVKMALLALLAVCASTLSLCACAAVSRWGVSGLSNAGPHGLSQMLYAYASASSNNGSAFAGLAANTPWYNMTLALAMLIGRCAPILAVLALAGSLAQKKSSPPGIGTFPVHGGLFVGLLLGTLVLVGALSYLPALALGPVVEHFLVLRGTLF